MKMTFSSPGFRIPESGFAGVSKKPFRVDEGVIDIPVDSSKTTVGIGQS